MVKNDTTADITLSYPVDYRIGTVLIEVKRDEGPFHRLDTDYSQLFGEVKPGPVPVLKAGESYAGFIPLIVKKGQERVFDAHGIYSVRVGLYVKQNALIRSNECRVVANALSVNEAKFLLQHWTTITCAIGADFDGCRDSETVEFVARGITDSGIRTMLETYASLNSVFKKNRFKIDTAFKNVVDGLRKERGNIMTDYYLLRCADYFVTVRKWEEAKQVLLLIPDRSYDRDHLSAVAAFESTADSQRKRR